MNKILLALSIGIVSIAAFSYDSYAQNSAQPVAFNDTKAFKLSVRDMTAPESPGNISDYVPDAKKFNTKAIRDFQNRYAEVNNAMWFSDANSLVSYFVKDGFSDRVIYDKKGNWEYSLIFYGEDKLPHDVRFAIKSTYFDMSITLVEEVQTTQSRVYIVHLEDKSNIRILKANDEGEYETLQELSKE